MTPEEKLADIQAQIARLQREAASLKSEVAGRPAGAASWVPKGYYTAYHVLAGMVLGFVAAAASLLFNIIGSALVGQDPLHLIQVYLTFPLGEKALHLQDGFTLAAGCCLYLGTGMFGGIPFHLILSRFFARSPLRTRFLVATGLGLGVWIINFYGLIQWLQPLLIGGDWIVQEIPFYVAAATHLIFGWTMLLVDEWGRFAPAGDRMREIKRA